MLIAGSLFLGTPGYVGMIFRRSFADLKLPNALMDRSHEWWDETDARWVGGENMWEFPCEGGGYSYLGFGYLDKPFDHLRYKSMEAQYIGIDESTDFRTTHLEYMITRLRRRAGVRVPTRMRFAGNPGGEAHTWHGERFVHPEQAYPERPFIPATLDDNPHADREDYAQTLTDVDETTYRQLRFGEWVQDESAVFFRQAWWDAFARPHSRYDPSDPRRGRLALARFAAVDTAEKTDEHNARTALVVGELTRDWKLDIVHTAIDRLTFDSLLDWLERELAPYAFDGKLREVFIEDASSGVQLIQVIDAGGSWLRPYVSPSVPWREGKEARWRAAALWCRRDCVRLPLHGDEVPWLHAFEQEVFNVPNAAFKDQADAFAMLINETDDREEAPISAGWQSRQIRQARSEGTIEPGVVPYIPPAHDR